jgi:hypothetical protein
MKWKDILKQEWEIRPCWSGTGCWCRCVRTKGGATVIDGTVLEKELASYFVALHNARLRNKRGYYSRIGNIYSKKFENIKFYDGDDHLISDNLMRMKWRVVGCGVVGHECQLIETVKGHTITHGLSFLILRKAKYFIKLHNDYLKEKNMAMSKKRKKQLAQEKSRQSNMKTLKKKEDQSKGKKKKRKPKKKR